MFTSTLLPPPPNTYILTGTRRQTRTHEHTHTHSPMVMDRFVGCGHFAQKVKILRVLLSERLRNMKHVQEFVLSPNDLLIKPGDGCVSEAINKRIIDG